MKALIGFIGPALADNETAVLANALGRPPSVRNLRRN